MRKIAITDIHGCYLSFEALLDKTAFAKNDELYLLGDFIDRGPGSKKVLDRIINLKSEGFNINCIAGNHDFAMLDAKTDPSFFSSWYNGWGGKQTMESFGVRSLDHIPGKYWDFINGLDMTIEIDGYIMVHAGLNFNVKNPLRPDIDMLYLRNWYGQIKYGWLGERKIIHGHTPMKKYDIEYMLQRLEKDKVIDIDGGCFAKYHEGKGYLCAFDFSNNKLYFQKCLDDVSGYWGR
ncbi:MAG TPA: serine/threonine protein phosphatase [Bacteroidetes bacterium]|nr:serine/threonine protein phosphatase [Bacteroidota bacterium]